MWLASHYSGDVQQLLKARSAVVASGDRRTISLETMLIVGGRRSPIVSLRRCFFATVERKTATGSLMRLGTQNHRRSVLRTTQKYGRTYDQWVLI